MTKRKPGALSRQETAAIARAAKALKEGPLEARFWKKVDLRGPAECWPWTACVRRKDEGYGAFAINRKHHPASRVAWVLTNGEIPPGLNICHECDNPRCCNPAHLFLGTNQQNNDDKVAKKRHAFGSRVGTAKLTEDQARAIKDARPSHGRAPRGLRTALADQFGVSYATIGDVWGRRWMHV